MVIKQERKPYHNISRYIFSVVNLTQVREVLWNLNSIHWRKILWIKDIKKTLLDWITLLKIFPITYYWICFWFNNFCVVVMKGSCNGSLLKEYRTNGQSWCNQTTLQSFSLYEIISTKNFRKHAALRWIAEASVSPRNHQIWTVIICI